MRAWVRRLSPPHSKLVQRIVRFPPRTMSRRRQQVPVIEPPVRFLAIFRHRLRSPMPRFVLHWALFVGENRPPPDAIARHFIEETVRNDEFPLLLWSVL